MTEQEAIKVFNTVLLLGKCELPADEANEAIKLSIKALEEIQQYREIGTVEKIKEELDRLRNDNECQGLYFTFEERQDLARQHKELEAYRSIGTVDECRYAVEKQIPKKIVRIKLRQSEYGSPFRCPVCESDLIQTEFFNEDGTESDEKISWCSGCGQKLDWN